MRKRNVDAIVLFRLNKRDKTRLENKAKRQGVKTGALLRRIVLEALAA